MMNSESLAKFESQVDKSSGCWLWTGPLNPKGYGTFTRRYKDGSIYRGAHRVAFHHFHGPIGVGLEIDHLCGNRLCVKPEHLDAVTHKENLSRADTACNLEKARAVLRSGPSPLRGTKWTAENKAKLSVVQKIRRAREKLARESGL